MRTVFMATLLAVFLWPASTLGQDIPSIDNATGRAEKLRSQARAALGGDVRLDEVRSISASGTLRRLSYEGDQWEQGRVNIDILLPDKFMKTQVMDLPRNQGQITHSITVNRDRAWVDTKASTSRTPIISYDQDGSEEERRKNERALRSHFTTALLAWFLTVPTPSSVQYVYVGEAVAEDGQADVLDVRGADGFAMRLFLDKATHLPLMISYRQEVPRVKEDVSVKVVNGRAQVTRKAQAENEAEEKEPELQYNEIELRYSNYRDVDGIQLPFRSTESQNGKVTEEWEMVDYKINPPLEPQKFQNKARK